MGILMDFLEALLGSTDKKQPSKKKSAWSDSWETCGNCDEYYEDCECEDCDDCDDD